MKKLPSIIIVIIAASILRLFLLNQPDINADEFHYIDNAFRFFNHDPYISIRHHPFQHPGPSIGHPFLAQIMTAGIFKIFGVSVYTSRLIMAIAGIATVIALLFFNKNLGGKVAFTGCLLLATIPFAVRYSRDAHLDSLFALWFTLIALSTWRYLQSKNILWIFIAGLACTFAISTKLDGIFSLILLTVLLFFGQNRDTFMVRIKNTIQGLFWAAPITIIISLFFNDPGAYLNGILKPSDPIYNVSFKQQLSRFVSLPFYIPKVFWYLLSPGVFIAYIISLMVLIKENSPISSFLIAWQAALIGLFVIHAQGVSGEYGWLPVIPVVCMTISYGLKNLSRNLRFVIIVLLTFTAAPYIMFYGLRTKPLPYAPAGYIFNRTLNDNYYQSVINEVNAVTPQKGSVFLLPQTNYPIFSLKKDLSWGYSGQLDQFNTFVVDDPNFLKSTSHIKLYDIKYTFQDGKGITRYIFIKN